MLVFIYRGVAQGMLCTCQKSLFHITRDIFFNWLTNYHKAYCHLTSIRVIIHVSCDIEQLIPYNKVISSHTLCKISQLYIRHLLHRVPTFNSLSIIHEWVWGHYHILSCKYQIIQYIVGSYFFQICWIPHIINHYISHNSPYITRHSASTIQCPIHQSVLHYCEDNKTRKHPIILPHE